MPSHLRARASERVTEQVADAPHVTTDVVGQVAQPDEVVAGYDEHMAGRDRVEGHEGDDRCVPIDQADRGFPTSERAEQARAGVVRRRHGRNASDLPSYRGGFRR